jgi:hypothetical protein
MQPPNAATSAPTSPPDLAAGPSLHQGVHHAKLVAVYNTQLRPENETPPCTSSEALGHAQIKLYADRLLEWTIFVNNKAEETFRAGHIHIAPPGVPGPIVQPLLPTGFSSSDRHIRLSGSVVISATLFNNLLANPANYYVNLHTTVCPAGAIRGQLP